LLPRASPRFTARQTAGPMPRRRSTAWSRPTAASTSPPSSCCVGWSSRIRRPSGSTTAS